MYGTNRVPKLNLEKKALNIVIGDESPQFAWTEISPRAVRTIDPVDAYSSNASAFSITQNSCISFVESQRVIMEQNGVDFEEIVRLASSYDALRQLRRTNVVMLEHNDDRQLYDYFTR